MKSLDLGRLGGFGVAGVGLMLFCLSYYMGTIGPNRGRLSALALEEARLSSMPKAIEIPQGTPAASVAELPPLSSAPDLVARLQETATRHGLSVEHASYVLVSDATSRRYDVALPLKASYPTLRAFLKDVLELAPATLGNLRLTRTSATDPAVEATVQLTFYFAAP